MFGLIMFVLRFITEKMRSQAASFKLTKSLVKLQVQWDLLGSPMSVQRIL